MDKTQKDEVVCGYCGKRVVVGQEWVHYIQEHGVD